MNLELIMRARRVTVDAELLPLGSIEVKGVRTPRVGFTATVHAADTGELLDWQLTREELIQIARAAAAASHR